MNGTDLDRATIAHRKGAVLTFEDDDRGSCRACGASVAAPGKSE